MFYVIHGEDAPDSLAIRMANRPAHLQRLKDLQAQGHLLLAGPTPTIDSEDPGKHGFSGSLIVAEFASLRDAENWAAEDPYTKAGVYAEVKVRPFKKIFP